MSRKNTIQVIDTNSKQTLFECDISDSGKAYEYAAKMENMGLDIYVKAPCITDTLSNTLGVSDEQARLMKESAHDEIADHEGSCCATPNKLQ